MGKLIDLTNKQFGRLTVITQAGKTVHGHILWLCKCSCGNVKKITGINLKRDITKSCGCFRLEKIRLALRKEKGVSGLNQLYSSYKRSAKRRNHSFSLSKSAFKELTSGKCYYCGRLPHRIKVNPAAIHLDAIEHSKYIFNGIDRLNNKHGYSKSNAVSCCRDCNFLKSRLNYKEFINQIKRISIHLCLP